MEVPWWEKTHLRICEVAAVLLSTPSSDLMLAGKRCMACVYRRQPEHIQECLRKASGIASGRERRARRPGARPTRLTLPCLVERGYIAASARDASSCVCRFAPVRVVLGGWVRRTGDGHGLAISSICRPACEPTHDRATSAGLREYLCPVYVRQHAHLCRCRSWC